VIPERLRPFFWDVNRDHFDPISYPDYTIARILEYGDEGALDWLKTLFSAAEIKRVLCTERRLSRRSASFWALVYRVPAEQVAALQSTSSGYKG
jgi:hypothetical protein